MPRKTASRTLLREIIFQTLPPAGLGVSIQGQRYDLLELEGYTRRDGTPTHLGIWLTECAVCGVAFKVKSSAWLLPEARRCEDHKAPGRHVSARADAEGAAA